MPATAGWATDRHGQQCAGDHGQRDGGARRGLVRTVTRAPGTRTAGDPARAAPAAGFRRSTSLAADAARSSSRACRSCAGGASALSPRSSLPCALLAAVGSARP
ncbi:hypothetical protein QJS66_19165 [Kocuria rhizophila]|nr:hypothetical protein QJS66_19165 [Kocuria rhizophila]